MLALIIDVIGSYFLIQKTSRWLYLMPLAVLLGVVSSFSTNFAMHYIWPDMFPPAESAMKAVIGSVLHPLFCVFCMWWFRRKKLKAQASSETTSYRISDPIANSLAKPEAETTTTSAASKVFRNADNKTGDPMKWIAIALNTILISTVGYLIVTEGAPSGGKLFFVALLFVAPICSLIALTRVGSESWIGLYFKRKALEEKQRIKSLQG